MLFQLWSGGLHRATRDLDLLGQGPSIPARIAAIFKELCDLDVTEDGLRFLASSVDADVMKPDEEYQGIRVQLDCRLEKARIRVQIDVGFGDAVTPQPSKITFPVALDFPAPVLRAYPKESVVAEKLQAMVVLGIANSGMKDFYDLWYLATHFEFDGRLLSDAIKNTFARRVTLIPNTLPLALTDEFAEDAAKVKQWTAFVAKGKLLEHNFGLKEVVTSIRDFVGPVLDSIVVRDSFDTVWRPEVGWQ